MSELREASNPAENCEEYLAEINELANQLLDVKFQPWEWQQSLLSLQRRVQGSISDLKAGARGESFERDMQTLSHCRYHSKLLGDSFAWVVLGLDRARIGALGENSPVPIARHEEPSSLAVSAIVSSLAQQGWGFPLLHDVTDCLRIGDVTFIAPRGAGDRRLTTAEIKSKLISQEPAEDGLTNFNFEVTLLGGEPFPLAPPPPAAADPTTRPPAAPRRSRRRPRLDARANRQLRRMDRAHQKLGAVGKGPLRIGDDQQQTMIVRAEASIPLPPEFAEMLKTARREGAASFLRDSATLYCAIYAENGVDEQAIASSRFLDDLQASGILESNADQRDSLVLYSCPGDPSRHDREVMPYFLLSVPRWAIADLLHSRLVIFALVTRSRVSRALKEAGFELTSATGETSFDGDDFVISWRCNKGGSEHILEIHNFGREIVRDVRELSGIDGFIAKVRSMATSVEAAVESKSLDFLARPGQSAE